MGELALRARGLVTLPAVGRLSCPRIRTFFLKKTRSVWAQLLVSRFCAPDTGTYEANISYKTTVPFHTH